VHERGRKRTRERERRDEAGGKNGQMVRKERTRVIELGRWGGEGREGREGR